MTTPNEKIVVYLSETPSQVEAPKAPSSKSRRLDPRRLTMFDFKSIPDTEGRLKVDQAVTDVKDVKVEIKEEKKG